MAAALGLAPDLNIAEFIRDNEQTLGAATIELLKKCDQRIQDLTEANAGLLHANSILNDRSIINQTRRFGSSPKIPLPSEPRGLGKALAGNSRVWREHDIDK